MAQLQKDSLTDIKVGSTAKMMVALQKRASKLDHVPNDNPALKRMTALEARICHTGRDIRSMATIDSLQRDVEINVNNLQALDKARPFNQSRAAVFKPQFEEITSKVSHLKAEQSRLNELYVQLVKAKERSVKDIFGEKHESPQNAMNSLTLDLEKLKKQSSKYLTEKSNLEKQLGTLVAHTSVGIETKPTTKVTPTTAPGL